MGGSKENSGGGVGPIVITEVILVGIVVIDTGDCPVVADVIVTDGSTEVTDDIETGDCPGVVVDITSFDCPGVVVDITTGDFPGVVVNMETGDCPLVVVVTGPGDFDGEGVVNRGEVERRPVGAASHREKVSEVLGSVAWKQNWSSGFPSFI